MSDLSSDGKIVRPKAAPSPQPSPPGEGVNGQPPIAREGENGQPAAFAEVVKRPSSPVRRVGQPSGPRKVAGLLLRRKRARLSKERVIARLVQLNGIVAIATILLIFVFLLKDAVPAFRALGIWKFVTGNTWSPDAEQFGLLPLLAGSFFVTAGAVTISVPIGIACAVYVAEVAPRAVREALKPTIEVLAGIPSVVIGFIGLTIAAPFLQNLLDLPIGLTALTGSVMLAFMAMPTIISISEDAIVAVPKSYRDASLALGASKWETIRSVVVPAAKSGITAACMLGIGRAVGETMTVLMVTGNAPVTPEAIGRIVEFFTRPVRTMTATIALEMGDTVQHSLHYHALFAVGFALFAITFLVNLTGDIALRRGRS